MNLRTYTKFGMRGRRVVMGERESRRDLKKWNPTIFPKEMGGWEKVKAMTMKM
jgi:hypothetical protein